MRTVITRTAREGCTVCAAVVFSSSRMYVGGLLIGILKTRGVM
jgi:hypothetical protein